MRSQPASRRRHPRWRPDHAGPVNHVLPAWDIACGLYAAVGLLAADRHRLLQAGVVGPDVAQEVRAQLLVRIEPLAFLDEAYAIEIERRHPSCRIGRYLAPRPGELAVLAEPLAEHVALAIRTV